MKFKKIAITLPAKKPKALVMDDNPSSLAIAQLMLEAYGYDAYLTKDGNETISLYEKAKHSLQPFDIVILDLNNPQGMGGEEIMRSLLDIDPEVRALVSSGDVCHPVVTDYENYGFCGSLPKPFTVNDLERVLTHAKNKDVNNDARPQ